MGVKFSDFVSSTLGSDTLVVGYDQSTSDNIQIPYSDLVDGINAANIFKSVVDGTVVSGTTSATITMSQLIPANTFSVGDIIRIRSRFRKTVINGNTNFIISVNTSNSLVGATSLALMTANTRFNQMKRDFYIKSATNTEGYASAVAVTNDDSTQATAVSTSNINWGVNQYIIFSITQGATDSGLGSGYSIERL
jgi:hypothetical protein